MSAHRPELLKQTLWEQVRELVFKGLSGRVGPLFRKIIVGNTGLFYIALSLSGILLMIPMLGESHFMQPERALLRGAFLLAFFVSSTLGIDVVQKIEVLRVNIGKSTA